MATGLELEERRRVLFTMLTALSFGYPPGHEPPLIPALHQWLGGWPGIGRIVAGMGLQQYDLQLTRYGQEGWRATFYRAGIGALPDADGGLSVAPRAVDGGAAGGVGGAQEAGAGVGVVGEPTT